MEQLPWLLERDARLAVKVVFDTIAKGLIDGRRTKVRGFGAFWPRRLKPYMHHVAEKGKKGNYAPTLGKWHVRFRGAAWVRKALTDPQYFPENFYEDLSPPT